MFLFGHDKLGMPERCVKEESRRHLEVGLECRREVCVYPGV